MNSKQIVAALSAIALVVIIVYPAVSTGTIVIRLASLKPEKAEHAFVTINSIYAHQKGQSSLQGWKLIYNQTQTIDLVLDNITKTLPSAQLSVSSYDAIRVQVSNVTWVFNKTSTAMVPEPSQLFVNLDFAVLAGRESLVTLVLGGHREELRGTNAFLGTLTAKLS